MECKFCDYGGDILWENEIVFVKLARPHHKGHVHVVLKEHYENLNEISEKLAKDFFYDMVRVSRVIENILKPDKLNFFLFCNWVPHLHWHVVPRFREDDDYGNPPIIPRKNDDYEKRELREDEIESLRDAFKSLD